MAAEQARIREELRLGPGQLVVTMISRVIRSKGVLEFAEVAGQIRAVRPHVRCILAGPADGDARDRLGKPELAALRHSGIWIGPRSDVPALLSVSDIFVLPSAYPEGIPRVLLEAASMSLAIVTADAPGCREVVEHDVTGLLVPARDGAALREAIRRLLDAPTLRARFGQRARRLAVGRVGADRPHRRITAQEDDRGTPVGAMLRRFQIDELPQFWNVLRGEMAVVGPRAEDWDVVRQHYTPEQWRTLDIRPGMVSPADIA